MAKLVWRVKLVAELQPGVTMETEVARIERDEDANLAELGLRLEEAKQLTAALQAQMVPAQVTVLSECRRSCVACGSVLASKGHYPVRFRSLFGDVPLRVRRLLICPCQGDGEAKSSAVLDFDGNAVAPEAARRRRGEPISAAFVESAVNEIVARRMNKKQQMRWNRMTVQPFLDVRTAVLNGTLENAFRQRYPGFRPANDDHKATATAA